MDATDTPPVPPQRAGGRQTLDANYFDQWRRYHERRIGTPAIVCVQCRCQLTLLTNTCSQCGFQLLSKRPIVLRVFGPLWGFVQFLPAVAIGIPLVLIGGAQFTVWGFEQLFKGFGTAFGRTSVRERFLKLATHYRKASLPNEAAWCYAKAICSPVPTTYGCANAEAAALTFYHEEQSSLSRGAAVDVLKDVLFLHALEGYLWNPNIGHGGWELYEGSTGQTELLKYVHSVLLSQPNDANAKALWESLCKILSLSPSFPTDPDVAGAAPTSEEVPDKDS